MGKLKSGIIGSISGSVGGYTFATIRGQQILRTKKPRSNPQGNLPLTPVRLAYRNLSGLFNSLPLFWRHISLKDTDNRLNEFAVFVGLNLRKIIEAGEFDYYYLSFNNSVLQPTNFQVSLLRKPDRLRFSLIDVPGSYFVPRSGDVIQMLVAGNSFSTCIFYSSVVNGLPPWYKSIDLTPFVGLSQLIIVCYVMRNAAIFGKASIVTLNFASPIVLSSSQLNN